jgi:hypothetical protein
LSRSSAWIDLKNADFPVFFPDSREIRFGEGFAPDCIIRQAVPVSGAAAAWRSVSVSG